jgi:esterase/lipase superfamily enzyme/acyl carrier protein
MRARRIAVIVLLALLTGSADTLSAQPSGSQPRERPARATAGLSNLDEQLGEAVRSAIAAYFGVAVDEITDRTDLLRDLHADPMDAYEVVAMLCRDRGVVAPARDDLITVASIINYLKTAPRVQVVPTLRGWVARPGASGAGRERVVSRTLFYATDRAPTGSSAPDQYFSGERQAGNRLSYGTCEVTIPPAKHRAGQAEEPAWYKLEWEEDPTKHFMLKSMRPLEREVFFAEMRGSFRGSDRDTFVFVPGYNVSFARAARRTAQIAYDLDFQGVPILFSWPSAAKLTAYFADRENAEWSAAHLARFLRDIVAEVPGGRIHLLAHSMGNQALIRALNEIAARRGPNAPALFANVVLAAPDFDAQVFLEQLAPRVVGLSRQWTLYASDKDRALDAAAALSARRLGLPLPVARGIDTVDASGIDVAPWSVPEFHTYFASKQRVISDLAQVLRGTPANKRNLLLRSKDDLPYWILAPL